jgi:hypothetical protein
MSNAHLSKQGGLKRLKLFFAKKSLADQKTSLMIFLIWETSEKTKISSLLIHAALLVKRDEKFTTENWIDSN